MLYFLDKYIYDLHAVSMLSVCMYNFKQGFEPPQKVMNDELCYNGLMW
jgi:hypothetical protein